MDEPLTQQLTQAATRLATAVEALENTLARLDAQHVDLTAKVDRIVAAIDETLTNRVEAIEAAKSEELKSRIAELETANADLKVQAARAGRKTLSPLATAVLAKNEGDAVDSAALDRALASLSVDQRIAVKAEMARAGMIE